MSACAGCGKELKRPNYAPLGDGKEYAFCSGRSYRSVSDTCVKKAVRKLRICPGCGEQGKAKPGFICIACKDAITQARSTQGRSKDLRWYQLDYRSWLPGGFSTIVRNEAERELKIDTHGFPEKLIQALVDAFVVGRSARCGSYLGYEYNENGTRKKAEPIVPDNYKHSYLGDVDGPAFEVTPEQAAALKTFLELLSKELRLQRMTGRKEGRSLLAGLASGELSVVSWTEKDNILKTGEDL